LNFTILRTAPKEAKDHHTSKHFIQTSLRVRSLDLKNLKVECFQFSP